MAKKGRLSRFLSALTVILALVLPAASVSQAAEVTWDGETGDSNWYTPENWNPNGVPTSADVVTIDVSGTINVYASSPPISFNKLVLGDTNSPTLVLSTNTEPGGHLFIKEGTFEQRSDELVTLSSITVEIGGIIQHTTNTATRQYVVNLKVLEDFDLQAGASIAVDSKGYTGGDSGTSPETGNGSGGGVGGTGTANAGGAGGGHGGDGGNGGDGATPAGGGGYDSSSNPTDLGSGGGGAYNSGNITSFKGGDGGGAVILDVVGTLTMDGLISANGAAGTEGDNGSTTRGAGGGGSGGSINITAGTLNGSGTVQADGGSGGTDSSGGDDPGGGGGGGRIAWSASACSFTGSFSAAGGSSGGGSAIPGDNGTWYPAPSGLAGAPQSPTQIDWSWSSLCSADNYQVLTSTSDTNISGNVGSTSFSETGLSTNTAIGRKVRALNGTFPSVLSSTVTVYTLAADPVISAFTNLTNTTLTTNWGTGGNPDGTSYTVELALSLSFSPALFSLTFSGGTKFTFTDLLDNTTYWARVKATNQDSVDTNWIVLGATVTFAGSLPAPVLSSPTTSSITLRVEPGDNPATTLLSITVSSDSFQTQSFVQSDGLLASTEVFQTKSDWNGGTVTVNGLSPNITYQFKVRAKNINGVNAQFSVISIITTLAATPEPPVLTVEHDSTREHHIHVMVAADNNSSATMYAIYYVEGNAWLQGNESMASVQAWKTVSQWTAGHSSNTHINLTVGQTYTYRLVAMNADMIMTSASDNVAIIIIQLGPVTAPTVTDNVIEGGGISTAESGRIGVSTGPTFKTTFSQAIDESTLATGVFIRALRDNLSNTRSEVFYGSFTYFPQTKSVHFVSSTPLNKGWTFEFVISTSVKDSIGIGFTEEQTSRFHTVLDFNQTNVVVASDGKTKVTIPPGALKTEGSVRISLDPFGAPIKAVAGTLSEANLKASFLGLTAIPGSVRKFEVLDTDGNTISDDFGVDVTIVIPVSPSTTLRPKTVEVWLLDETRNLWTRVLNSQYNASDDTIQTNVRHFSTYGVFQAPDFDLSLAYAFPVPWIPNDSNAANGTAAGGITFTNLASLCTIKIFTLTGEKVIEIAHNDGTATHRWDGRNPGGKTMASGTYIYQIKSQKDEKRGKLVIIR